MGYVWIESTWEVSVASWIWTYSSGMTYYSGFDSIVYVVSLSVYYIVCSTVIF